MTYFDSQMTIPFFSNNHDSFAQINTKRMNKKKNIYTDIKLIIMEEICSNPIE